MNKLAVLGVITVFMIFITSAPGLQAESPSDTAGTTVHMVRRGDCLSKIAQKYGTTVNELVEINRLPDQNVISVGQPILIKAAGKSVPASVQGPGKASAVEIFIEKEPADPDYLKIKELNKKLNDNIQTAQYRQALEMTEQILASVTKFKEKLTEVVEVLP